MSRYYGMEVSIDGHAPDRIDAVKAAAGQIWPFEHWSDGSSGIVSYAEERLCGGESEEEFSLRLAEAIWQANAVFCHVSVKATYLEELPYELHCPDEDDYRRFVRRRRKRGRQHRERR